MQLGKMQRFRDYRKLHSITRGMSCLTESAMWCGYHSSIFFQKVSQPTIITIKLHYIEQTDSMIGC